MQYVIGRHTSPLGYNGNLLGFRKAYRLPPYTLRVEFSTLDYVPANPHYPEATIQKVQGVQTNQWDIHYESSDWTRLLVFLPSSYTAPRYKIIDTGDLSGVTNMHRTFNSTNLTETCWFDTRNVTDMNGMFQWTYLRTIPSFNTHKVTDMCEMFDHCTSFEVLPWLDTSSVTTMEGLMAGTQIESFPAIDTHNVTNMWDMFRLCHNLKYVPTLDTSSLTTMRTMFYSCISLPEASFTDTSKVTDMRGVFWECVKLKRVPYMDVSSLEDISLAFNSTYLVEGGAYDLYNRAKEVIPAENTSAYVEAFRGCGEWTETGAAELAMIPDAWK